MKATIFLLVSFFLLSCGARKKTVEKNEIRTEIVQIDTTEIKENRKDTASISEINTEIELTPIDSLRPIVIVDAVGNAKTVQNAVVRIKKTQKQTNQSQFKLTEIKKGEIKSEIAVESSKKSDLVRKESVGFKWFFIIIAVGFVGLAFLRLRKS